MPRATVDLMEYANDAAAQAAYVTNAVEGIDQSYDGAENNYFGHSSKPYTSQGFTPSKSGVRKKASFKLKIGAGTPSGTLTCYVYTGNAGKPGTLIGTLGTAAASGLTGSYAYLDFTGSGIYFAAGTQYHYVLYGASLNDSNYVHWACTASGSSYTGGYENYSTDGVNWNSETGVDCAFKDYVTPLQDYSESTIKVEGSYSIKGIANTDALNKTLTKTVSPTIDLSNKDYIGIWVRSSRTGSNIKIGFHDSGGTTTELTLVVNQANALELKILDLSAVANANKDAINQIIITIVNADADNTFYIDCVYADNFINNLKFYRRTRVPGAITGQ